MHEKKITDIKTKRKQKKKTVVGVLVVAVNYRIVFAGEYVHLLFQTGIIEM